MNGNLRIATRRDYHAIIMVRAEWLDNFWRNHPAHERWCPACCSVPKIENEREVVDYLPKGNHLWTHPWAVVSESKDRIAGYMLCLPNEKEHKLLIEGQTPRVSPGSPVAEITDELIKFAVKQASKQNLCQVCAVFHGFPDEVGPIMDIYKENGFKYNPRYEMVGDS